jgi:hypothetical protein
MQARARVRDQRPLRCAPHERVRAAECSPGRESGIMRRYVVLAMSPSGRQNVAPGVSPGYSSREAKPRNGAKDLRSRPTPASLQAPLRSRTLGAPRVPPETEHSLCVALSMSPSGRQNVAPGVSPGYSSQEAKPRNGAKDLRSRRRPARLEAPLRIGDPRGGRQRLQSGSNMSARGYQSSTIALFRGFRPQVFFYDTCCDTCRVSASRRRVTSYVCPYAAF